MGIHVGRSCIHRSSKLSIHIIKHLKLLWHSIRVLHVNTTFQSELMHLKLGVLQSSPEESVPIRRELASSKETKGYLSHLRRA
ncbi:hypothetical protein SORBI_3001G341550 [Sorghum bicolor]|uniref:Uncharacterized protein n=1 Tax=Sorghum bicolor TaxID=4558 RepID=A0A1Z5S8Z2_SORBI|nr:hypothetical protein SORBI_3001G341550 [Sorghum bicolor]